MQSKSIIIQKAEFNPKIQTYILLIGVISLTVSIVGIPLLFIWLMGLGQYIAKKFYKSLGVNIQNI